MKKDDLDLAAVARSVARYDAQDALVEDGLDVWPHARYLREISILDGLRQAVSVAFADATSDRNCRDTALLVAPGKRDAAGGTSWLRQLLRRQGLYYG